MILILNCMPHDLQISERLIVKPLRQKSRIWHILLFLWRVSGRLGDLGTDLVLGANRLCLGTWPSRSRPTTTKTMWLGVQVNLVCWRWGGNSHPVLTRMLCGHWDSELFYRFLWLVRSHVIITLQSLSDNVYIPYHLKNGLKVEIEADPKNITSFW